MGSLVKMADGSHIETKCFEIVSKVYAMVDDPSTDSIISWSDKGNSFIAWNPAKCCSDLFPKLLGFYNFKRFERFGFKLVESKHVEYACDDFVRGKPELLVNISKRYKEKYNGSEHCKKMASLIARLRKSKTNEEKDLAVKDFLEQGEKKRRPIMDRHLSEELKNLVKSIESERERRGGEALSKDVEDQLQLAIKALHDLVNPCDA